MNTKLKWMVLGSLLGMFGTGKAMAANPVDGSITVTPVATVSLTLTPTTYAFGNLAVNTSSVSASALTLANAGQVTVDVDKRIETESAPGGWTAAGSAAQDAYALYVATSVARLSDTSFAPTTLFGAQANVTDLTGPAGVQPTIAPAGNVALWFKLDMPTSVTSQTARTITVRFTGAAQ